MPMPMLPDSEAVFEIKMMSPESPVPVSDSPINEQQMIETQSNQIGIFIITI